MATRSGAAAARKRKPVDADELDEPPARIGIKKKTKKAVAACEQAGSEFVDAEVGMRALQRRLSSQAKPANPRKASTAPARTTRAAATRATRATRASAAVAVAPATPASAPTPAPAAASKSADIAPKEKAARSPSPMTTRKRKTATPPSTKKRQLTLAEARAHAVRAQQERVESRVQELQQAQQALPATVEAAPPPAPVEDAPPPASAGDEAAVENTQVISSNQEEVEPAGAASSSTVTEKRVEANTTAVAETTPTALGESTMSNGSGDEVISTQPEETAESEPAQNSVPEPCSEPAAEPQREQDPVKSEFFDDFDDDMAFIQALDEVEQRLNMTPMKAPNTATGTQPTQPVMSPKIDASMKLAPVTTEMEMTEPPAQERDSAENVTTVQETLPAPTQDMEMPTTQLVDADAQGFAEATSSTGLAEDCKSTATLTQDLSQADKESENADENELRSLSDATADSSAMNQLANSPTMLDKNAATDDDATSNDQTPDIERIKCEVASVESFPVSVMDQTPKDNATDVQVMPLDVLEELERLKRENEALRISNEKLQAAAKEDSTPGSSTTTATTISTNESLTSSSTVKVEANERSDNSDSAVSTRNVPETVRQIHSSPSSEAIDDVEKSAPFDNGADGTSGDEMNREDKPFANVLLLNERAPTPSDHDSTVDEAAKDAVDDNSKMWNDSDKCMPTKEVDFAESPQRLPTHKKESAGSTMGIKMQNPPAVTFATDSEDEEEHDEKARVPQRPSRAHLHVEESQTESEMEDDEHHDASSDGDSDVGGNTNVLEAALKAATTSNVSVTNGTPATRPTFKPISQKRTQANSEKNIAVVNPTANRKRPRTELGAAASSAKLDTTFARKSATNSTKCKSTLLWPNLDDFFEFILCLSPSQTRLPDKRQRYLRKFKQRGLPAVYDNVNDYCCAQMEAIMEELVASVRSAKELTSYNMRKSLFLTSVSPCSSAHSISDAFPTAQTRLNASAIFSESGFSGTTSGQHDFILTFHANEVKKTANSEFVNGDLLLLRSPPWKNYQLRFFGIVLCNSVVAVGAGGGNPNENEQICVLVRADPATLGDECGDNDEAIQSNLFSTITEMCLSNQKASNWRWSLENVHNITTSAREFQAIKSIPMLPPDITDILVKGSITSGPNTAATDDELTKLSPRLVTELRSKYNVPQLKAIAGAVGEAKHIIIQGPPGTGKTKTILGILSALLDGAALGSAKKRVRIRVGASLQDDRSPAKPKTVAESTIRVLVAAPSNAAVDELLVRLLSEGVFDGTKGSSYRPRIVRVGRPESLQQQQRSQKNEPDNKKIRKKWRKYAHEVEEILLENLVTKHRNAFPSAKIARQEILKNAQIVFCTLSGAGSVAMCDFPQEFDALVVDEAAQAVEASTLIPFKFKPSRVILVGDHRQLPATVISKRLIELRYDRSMFERFVDNKSPVFLLNNQYRMHPEISQFPSRQFYQGKLVQEREIKDWTTRKYHQDPYFKPFLFFDVLGGQQSQVRGSKSLRNLSEVEFVLMLVRTLLTRFSEMEWKKKIGIIAPYKQQIHELGTKLGHLEQQFDRKLEIEINTVDGFQGREKDIIIYSCVRTSGGKRGNNAKLDAFWADVRRMNVAITRAKSSLWIIGNSQLLEQSAAWRALIEDTKSRELYLLDSEFIANNGATIGISTNTIATPATAASGDDRNNNNNTNNKSENNSSNSNSRGKRSGGRRSRKHKKAKKEQNP